MKTKLFNMLLNIIFVLGIIFIVLALISIYLTNKIKIAELFGALASLFLGVKFFFGIRKDNDKKNIDITGIKTTIICFIAFVVLIVFYIFI